MIRNDGPKCAPRSALPRFGVGLTNTIDRLQIQYGDRHTFLYSDRPEGGVQIHISLPYNEAGDGAAAAAGVGPAGSICEPPSAMDRNDRTSGAAAPTIGYT
jgi:hypothetical protein